MAEAAEGEEVPAAPEPVPPLPDAELEGKRDLVDAWFKSCSSDVAKLASLNERAAIPPEEDEDAAKKAERELRLKSLTYGEVNINVLHTMLNTIKTCGQGGLYPNKGAFLDFGSGAGKACINAALLNPFEKVIGVECLQSLNDLANKALGDYTAAEIPDTTKPPVEFIKSDFVADFEAAIEPLAAQVVCSLAVANSYRDDQMQALGKFASKMPDGSFFICTGQGLPDTVTFGLNRNPLQRRAVNVKRCLAKRGSDPDTTPIEEPEVHEPVGWVEISSSPMNVEMAWGQSKCFIYYKVPGPFSKAGPFPEGPWPMLVGVKKDEAQKKLAEARADLQIELVAEDTMDAAALDEEPVRVPERVRIFFNSVTDLVVEPAPVCG